LRNRQKTQKSGIMFRLRMILPWAAVILILLVGYMSVNLIRSLLPDYRDEIVSYEKAERNSPIYLQGDDSIAIYPWNEYDESGMITLEEYLLQGEIPSRPDVLGGEKLSSEYVQEGFREMSDFLAPWVIIEDRDMDGLTQAVTCEIKEDDLQCYLKDFSVNSSGEEYLTSLFFDAENLGFFYHYQNAAADRVSSAQINAAQETMQRSIEEIGELYQLWMSDGIPGEYRFSMDADQLSELMRENPVIRAWYRLIAMSQGMEMDFMADMLTEMTYVLSQAAQGNGNYELAVYRGELLAIFSDDLGNRVVMYYDPVQREVSGLSVRIGQSGK